MPDYKITFVYEQGKSGFTEVFYRSATTPQEAANTISASRISSFLGIRIGGTILRAIKATEVSGLRKSYIRTMNMQFPAGALISSGAFTQTVATPDVTAVCAQLRFGFNGGGSRIVNVRALGDVDTLRSVTFNDVPSSRLQQLISDYAAAVVVDFKGQRLVDAGVAGFPWIPAASIAAHPTNPAWSRITVGSQTQFSAIGDLLYFRGVDRAIFPGLRGVFRLVSVPTSTTLDIGYKYREAVSSTGFTDTQVRKAAYTYPALIGAGYADTFVALTTRKTGRPIGLRRGRAVGLRLRQ
jgi:hypothetical protein